MKSLSGSKKTNPIFRLGSRRVKANFKAYKKLDSRDAGGVGLNLQNASAVINMDLPIHRSTAKDEPQQPGSILSGTGIKMETDKTTGQPLQGAGPASSESTDTKKGNTSGHSQSAQ